MCEIILLWALGKNLAQKCRAKGHAPTGYVVLMVVLWFFGEIAGLILGFVVTAALSQNRRGAEQDFNIAAYFCAIVGAALAAIISFGIVSALPDRSRDEYEERWPDRDRLQPRDIEDKWDQSRRPNKDDPWAQDERFER
jgi:hypothetical protein